MQIMQIMQISAFKHRISIQFIEQQSPLEIKTFSQGIYTKQLTFGVFKHHWNLRYVDPSFYEETVFCFASTISRTSLSRISLCNSAWSRTKAERRMIQALFVK